MKLNKKNKTLFLHYGPGGNSQVERLWYPNRDSLVNFWDQPVLMDQGASYDNLVSSCLTQLTTLSGDGPVNLVGHSFGCDLVMALLKKAPEKISEVHLISPILDLPLGFRNMGSSLLRSYGDCKSDTGGLLSESVEALSLLDQKLVPVENWLPLLWDMVGVAVQHPQFGHVFWKNEKARQRHGELATKCEPLNFPMWSAVLNSFFGGVNPRGPALDVLPETSWIYLGEQDPYLNITKDRETWEKAVGRENVKVLVGVGHYPHFESQINFF